LLAIATPVLQRFAPSVRVVPGSLSQGLPPGGPWSLIMIEGAVPEIPADFAAHVADAGRLVAIIVQRGAEGRYGLGHAVLAEPVGTGAGRRLRAREVFDCSTPVLPGFERIPAFTF
jgi:protein-L-isoaspartate(D-aspartate) O-methyltransferase